MCYTIDTVVDWLVLIMGLLRDLEGSYMIHEGVSYNKVGSILEGLDKSNYVMDGYDRYNKINESSLSRIMKHVENGFFTMSAFRSENDKKQNKDATKKLMSDLKSEGLGFIQLIGGYVEHNQETGEPINVEEISLFVPYKNDIEEDKFLGIVRKLAIKYKQEGFIVCLPSTQKIIMYARDDISSSSFTETDLGKFNIKKMSNYYSRLKKGGSQTNIKYTFEGYRVPSSWINSVVMESEGCVNP